MALKVGDPAPDFVLKDQKNNDVRLSQFRGKKVILSFHPLAFTPVCATQMQQLDQAQPQLEALHTVSLGLSIDSQYSKAAWAEQIGIGKLPLLADFWPHGEVARRFDILRPEGFSERAVFVVDEQGVIVFARVYPIRELPDLNEIMAVLRK